MKNKVIKISLLCIAIVLMAITFYQIAKYEVINVSAKEENVKALTSTDYNIISEGSKWDLSDTTNTVWSNYIVQYSGKQIFCIQPGARLPGFVDHTEAKKMDAASSTFGEKDYYQYEKFKQYTGQPWDKHVKFRYLSGHSWDYSLDKYFKGERY